MSEDHQEQLSWRIPGVSAYYLISERWVGEPPAFGEGLKIGWGELSPVVHPLRG